MAITFVDDTADAGQTEFLFNFPYLEDEHVAVFIDGVRQTIGSGEDYTVQTSPSKRIVLNAAATGGEIVRVRRISDPANDLVDFQNGSVLTESELDRSYLHNRYLAEESAEQNDISLRVKAGADGQFDALNKKIINVSDPTADQDAATKNYVDDTVAGIVGGAIPNDSVTYAKLQNATGNNVLLGNDNGADSDIQELSAAEAKTLLGLSTVATSGSYNDLSDQPSNGTVVSIASGPGLTGGPITTSGTLSLASIDNLRALGNVSGGSAAPVAIEIKDEDAMTSDSATALATQQSIKAYVDDSGSVTAPTGNTVATSGTSTLPGGLIIKFGQGSSSSDAEQTFSFPTSFPNNHFSTVISRTDADSTVSLHPTSISTSGFTIDREEGIDGTVVFNFISIGN